MAGGVNHAVGIVSEFPSNVEQTRYCRRRRITRSAVTPTRAVSLQSVTGLRPAQQVGLIQDQNGDGSTYTGTRVQQMIKHPVKPTRAREPGGKVNGENECRSAVSACTAEFEGGALFCWASPTAPLVAGSGRF